MVFEMFFPQNTFKNHFVGSLGLGASTFWLPQPNPPNSKGDLNAVFRSGWQGKDKGRWQSAGKGLKLHGRVWGPGRTCFAQVLKPSKCRISTWQGRGKGRKVHRRVPCPSEMACLAQVWKPSKCNIRPGKALAKD